MLENHSESLETSQKIFTVSELSSLLKDHVEQNFSHITLKAEISGLKIHTSGHAYFCLKDNESLIDGICWRGVLQKIPMRLEDGLEIICSGRITTYPARSKYQIVVQNINLSGQGTLLKLLEERKKKLAQEGLFSPERKQLLPFLPQRIGIVTSVTGSVIRDILHRIADRFPVHIVIWPTLVQGDGAADQITLAIQGFNNLPFNHPLKPDLIIVARGGGSIEDLWCFNEENVVRATANSLLPLISAVGHETDVTLIDYAADYRAPTPTAAAEVAVPIKIELEQAVKDFARRLKISSSRIIFEHTRFSDDRFNRFHVAQLTYINRKSTRISLLKIPSPQMIIDKMQQHFDHIKHLYHNLYKELMRRSYHQLDYLSKLLLAYSHEGILSRGFCLVLTDHDKLITRKNQISSNENLTIKFQDGTARVKAL